jgi:MFS family permease
MTTNRLTLATRLLIAGDAVSSLGSGLVLPLTLIYLHQVRGIALPLVGVLLAGSAALGLVAVPLAGVLIDRVGARPVLVTVLVAQGLSEAGLAWAHSVPTALPSMLLLGISMGPFFPAFTMMMAGINPDPNVQQRAFALNFTVLNAGIGAGGGIGAAVANVHHPGSFQILFLANALSCVLFAGLLTRLPNPRAHRDSAPGQRQPSQRQPQPQSGQPQPEQPQPEQPQSGQPQPEQPKPGYRDVLAQRGLRTVMIASLMLAFTGYAALDSGLPAYATVKAHVSVHVVALAITVNTVIIVAAQLAVLRLLRVLRRSRALMAVGLIWGVAWAVFGLAALPAAAGLRVACVFAFAGLFGLGETFMAPTIAPLVNSLAAERVRGRANALSSVAYSIAFVVSPAIATGMIAGGLAVVWIGLLCLGCLGTALLGVRLGRQLTHAQDRVEPTVARAPEPTPV